MSERRISSDQVLEVTTLHETDESTTAWIALRGVNRRVINHRSDTTYTVVHGHGSMRIGEQDIDLQEGSSITVLAGTAYQDQGELYMLAVSRPPFDQSAVEYLDD